MSRWFGLAVGVIARPLVLGGGPSTALPACASKHTHTHTHTTRHGRAMASVRQRRKRAASATTYSWNSLSLRWQMATFRWHGRRAASIRTYQAKQNIRSISMSTAVIGGGFNSSRFAARTATMAHMRRACGGADETKKITTTPALRYRPWQRTRSSSSSTSRKYLQTTRAWHQVRAIHVWRAAVHCSHWVNCGQARSVFSFATRAL